MDERLAACADGDAPALCQAIRCMVRDARASSSDSAQPTESAEGDENTTKTTLVPRVLQHLVSQSRATCHAVASILVTAVEGEEQEQGDNHRPLGGGVYAGLLSGLLQHVRQRMDDENIVDDREPEPQPATTQTLQSMLVAYARRIVIELTRDTVTLQDSKTLSSWADAVVGISVAIHVDAAPVDNGEAAPTDENGKNTWVVELLNAFLRIHRHSAANRNDFRIMTAVWKNVNKLSTVYRVALLSACGEEEQVAGDTHTTATTDDDFSVGKVFDAAATSLAQVTQQLRVFGANEDAEYQQQMVIQDLKMLRLFLRAFQGQFIQFVDALVAQVECSVALVVDVVAAVVPIAEGLVVTSDKIQHEAFRVLQCALGFFEMVASANDNLQASTRSFVGSLLWQHEEKMQELVVQTRTQFVDDTEESKETSQASILWGHTLALAAFFSAQDVADGASLMSEPLDTHTAFSVSTNSGSGAVYTGIAALLTRFRGWGKRVFVGEYTKTQELFVDLILHTLAVHVPADAESIHTLQLFLIEQMLVTDPNQRFLVWEIWRELMCFVWGDCVATQSFNTLVSLTESSSLDGAVRDEIVRLVSFLYPELSDAVKHECLCRVSAVFDLICAEGPSHKPTPQVSSSLHLMDLLASSSLLVEYDQSDKEEWVAHYLPMALQCIGSVHDVLERSGGGQAMTTNERNGIVRVLDAGLLVIRAILEDNDGMAEPGVQGLTSMLLPMCAETLTQLAKISSQQQATKPPPRSFTRALQSCLLLLTKLSPLVKANRSNQCVQVIKDLVAIVHVDHELTPRAVCLALFVRDALCDIQVASGDADVSWKLVSRLFYKLSALNFGLQVSPTPQNLTPTQSLCLEALYAVVSKSNLPEFATRKKSIKEWVVPHAHGPFAAFVQMMCSSKSGGGRGLPASDNSARKWFREDTDDLDRLLLLRFPHLQSTSSDHRTNNGKKRAREDEDEEDQAPLGDDDHHQHSNTTTMPREPVVIRGDAIAGASGTVEMIASETVENDTDTEMIDDAKQIKWDAFGTIYWKLHDHLLSLTTAEDQYSFLENITENELDKAACALQQLLPK